ncbi:YeeE/YedE family protein [Rhodospirillum rubrum]|uniref:YeeE/YedE n=1 Tax=Rhodospirillum rubrum (strain ATCC 11170 / ATH 1.1.1 / DSM 467 / LMG 4362 / NCIMB 8255 / S1) TaxID=269796 RepID=Q2RTM9_RHORT|nr:YeeE/YedE family protein [Rhodospirillum rubrum]ABC22516.1 YeeE/YedE [Rhodospirillum rubrum ATCC 11170]AEO48233.1 YeeE/YedE [Rhodospirillum rubrum F11]MBK5954104.1 hypothetical protein [Rhodospirillum rubrum]QXG82145.1 YeeE/YedE family protein [Rhodospirillum rubrum]HAQ00429.1 YeeE/YedE family protein [Rhodospirillum rubrum]
MSVFWPPLLGGMLLGLSAALLLIGNGKVAGISGMAGRLLQGQSRVESAVFLIGLLLGPALYALIVGAWPAVTIVASWPVIVIAGLLVGFGTRMGSGCTSGHGIVGLARLSRRSLAATATFLVCGVLTASLMGILR